MDLNIPQELCHGEIEGMSYMVSFRRILLQHNFPHIHWHDHSQSFVWVLCSYLCIYDFWIL